jgi:hypothetical protein
MRNEVKAFVYQVHPLCSRQHLSRSMTHISKQANLDIKTQWALVTLGGPGPAMRAGLQSALLPTGWTGSVTPMPSSLSTAMEQEQHLPGSFCSSPALVLYSLLESRMDVSPGLVTRHAITVQFLSLSLL